MPIAGISDQIRIPRLGKIRLGRKGTNNAGKQYPQKVDYFLVDPNDGVTNPDAAQAFREVYGETPRELDIVFPDDDLEKVFPQYLTSYKQGSGLFCKGDGQFARRSNEQGVITDIPCAYEDCPFFKKKQCKPLAKLCFFLPKVPGLGIWQIDTGAFNSIREINSSIALLQNLTKSQIRHIPLKLRLVPQEVTPNGQKTTVYIMKLDVPAMKWEDLTKSTHALPNLPAANIEAPSYEEVSDDHFIESDLVEEQDPTQGSSIQQQAVHPEENHEPTHVAGEPHPVIGDFMLVAPVEVKPTSKGSAAQIVMSDLQGNDCVAYSTDPVIIEQITQVEVGKTFHGRLDPVKDKWFLTGVQYQ